MVHGTHLSSAYLIIAARCQIKCENVVVSSNNKKNANMLSQSPRQQAE